MNFPSVETRVRIMTEYAKSIPDSHDMSESQLANLVYDVVKKMTQNEKEEISEQIRLLAIHKYH